MAKIRVYKLAKELGLDNMELIQKLQALGVDVQNHMSTLSEEDADRFRAERDASSDAPSSEVRVNEVRIQPGVIRRRRTVEARPLQELPPGEETKEAKTGQEEKADIDVDLPPRLEIPVPLEPAERTEMMEEALDQEPVPTPETPAMDARERLAHVLHDDPLHKPHTYTPVLQEKPSGESAKPVGRAEPREAARTDKDLKKPHADQKSKKVTPGVKKRDDAEVDLEKPDGKKAHAGHRRKVVEYSVRKKKDLQWPREEGEFETKTPLDARKERKSHRRAQQKPVITVPKSIKRKIKMGETISVGELAKRLSVKSSEIIKVLMQNGIMASINQMIDPETAGLIATEFQYEIEFLTQEESLFLPAVQNDPDLLMDRPPVVTIMGHVNHGKTRLLDAIRKTNVMEHEAGGITQHIGAYTVNVNGKTIVFLDTPGHEAFTKMRARGAKVTDIVVLVVAGDDGVMPQTVEAIHHAKAAKVPIIVAINKIDLPGASMDKTKQELSEHGLLSEDWGGDTLFVGISAKEGIGIPELLEYILLQAEMIEQKANPHKQAAGVIIEARLDRNLGPVATVLVRSGTLRVGDPFVTGVCYGKVRALISDRGDRIDEAGPSIPVEVLGWSGVPEAGDMFSVVDDEKKAKVLSSLRFEKARQAEVSSLGKISLEELYEKIKKEEMKDLNVILKGDVQGSIEALGEALTRLSNEEINVRILHSGVGGVTESDVMLASASQAVIIGFNVRAEMKAMNLLDQENVEARFYTVIYDAVSDLKAALTGMMKPVFKEVLIGHAEIRETFSISRVGTIAGSHVLDGKIERSAQVRVLRDNIVVHEGKLASLRRFKDDVKEVLAGYECGIRMENFNDVKTGDILESYIMERVIPRNDGGSPLEKRAG
jgi:translation initiation factor IF-2